MMYTRDMKVYNITGFMHNNKHIPRSIHRYTVYVSQTQTAGQSWACG